MHFVIGWVPRDLLDHHKRGKTWILRSKRTIFVQEKMPNPPKRLSAHQVYYKTLNLIFSASKQNIKNLEGNFGPIHVGTMHAKFQPSSFSGVGGRGGDRRKD